MPSNWHSQSAKQGNASARNYLENMRRSGKAVLEHRSWIFGSGTYYKALIPGKKQTKDMDQGLKIRN